MKKNSSHKSPRPEPAAVPPAREAAVSAGRLMWLLLTLAPLLALVAAVALYAVDVPSGDAWDFVPVLQKSYEGTLTLSDLTALHNEHRPLAPQVVEILLAHLTGWDMYYSLAFNLLLGVALWLVLAGQVRATAASLGRRAPPWLLCLLSLLVFSLAQSETWLYDTGMGSIFNACAAVAALCLLLGASEFRPRRFAGAVLVGAVATYTLGNGLLVWPTGTVLLLGLGRADRRFLRVGLPVWLVAGVAGWALYLHGYHPAAGTGAAVPGLSDAYLTFVRAYLGAPLWFVSVGPAAGLGLAGLLTVAGVSWLLVARRGVPLTALLPYLALATYALLSALLTGLGRAAGGAGMAMAPRYITISLTLWYAVAVLLWLALVPPPGEVPSWRKGVRVSMGAAGLALLACLVLLNGLFALEFSYQPSLQRLAPAPEALRAGNDSELWRVYPGPPEATREAREFLRREHLSVWRESRPPGG